MIELYLNKIDRKKSGEKAYNLALIKNSGTFNVPKSWVIYSDELIKCLEFNGITNEHINDSEHIKRFLTIRSVAHAMKKLRCCPDFYEKIKNVVESSYPKSIAVRSSFSFEDTQESSFAGFFSSTVNICGTQNVWDAIINTWGSAFTPLISSDTFKMDGLGILIQEYIIARCSGIGISQSYDNEDNILISYQDSNLESLTSGYSTGDVFICNRDKIGDITDFSFSKVAKAVLDLEKFYGFPVDVEWLIDDKDELYILQCRPIILTQKIKHKVNRKTDFMIMDVDEWTHESKFPINGIEKVHKRWLEKKHWVRRVAKDNNFTISKLIYVHIPKEGLSQCHCNLISSQFETEWIEICADSIPRTIIKRTEIDKITQNSTNTTVRFESMIETINAGIASCDVETGIVITDMVPGSVDEVRVGRSSPSRAIVKQGNVEFQMNEHMGVSRLNMKTGRWQQHSEDSPLFITVSEEEIREVAMMAKCFNNVFGETRVEWIHDGKKIYFFDVSFEDKSMRLDPANTRVICQGSAYAPILVIHNEDIEKLKNAWSGHVSVWREDAFYEVAENIDIIKLFNNYTNKDIKPIIVCEYPITHLALLVEHVAGFIFSKGSPLCHLAIILREYNIPSIFQDGCVNELKTNEWVLIK